MNRVFLDTNALLYAYDLTTPAKRNASLRLLSTTNQGNFSAVISTQVLQEFYNGLTRKLRIPSRDAAVELKNLMTLEIVSMTPTIVVAATEFHAAHSLSFWDALILAAAQSARCDELWTEDFQAGRQFGNLKVVNPFFPAK